MRAETETIARIMATGFNRHVRDHGPDGDYAGEATETPGGHAVMVSRGGSEFAVRVGRSPAKTPEAPTDRIRWELSLNGNFDGYVGSMVAPMFEVHLAVRPAGAIAPWALRSDLLKGYSTGTDPDGLKAEAERWLEEYVTSLDAVFPPAVDYDRIDEIRELAGWLRASAHDSSNPGQCACGGGGTGHAPPCDGRTRAAKRERLASLITGLLDSLYGTDDGPDSNGPSWGVP